MGIAALIVVVVGVAEVAPAGAGSGRLPAMKVALVQGGGPRGTRAMDNTDPELVVQRQLAASASLHTPLDLVVWPEGVFQRSAPDDAAASALARRLHATVVAGAERDVGTTQYVNEVVAWGPDGKVIGRYQKHHLVPFGEYVPGRSLLKHFFNLADVPLDGIPGPGPGILRTPTGSLGVLISYEVFFDHLARDAVRAGGQGAWAHQYGLLPAAARSDPGAGGRPHAGLGDWQVDLQVTPTGYTAVVGPAGQVQQRSHLSEPGVLLATVPRRDGRTVYVDAGDTPFVVGACLLLGVAWILARARGRRKHRDQWTFPSAAGGALTQAGARGHRSGCRDPIPSFECGPVRLHR